MGTPILKEVEVRSLSVALSCPKELGLDVGN
jgi:hypothetical protein